MPRGFRQGLGNMGVNSGPLSNWREMGIPNQGMVTQRRGSETEPFYWLEKMSSLILRRCSPRTGGTQHICYGNVGKVKLPVSSRERASGLVGLERGAAITGVGV